MEDLQKLREAGFTDDEIASYYRPKLSQAGFTDDEINSYIGVQATPQPTETPTTPAPVAEEKTYGEALADAYHGFLGAVGQTGVDIAALIPKSAAYLGALMATGDVETARKTFRGKYNYELPSQRPEAKKRYQEGISKLFQPVEAAIEFITPSTNPEDYPAWEDVADMPGPVHPAQRDIMKGMYTIGAYEALGKAGRRVVKGKPSPYEGPASAAELGVHDEMIKKQARADEAIAELKELKKKGEWNEHLDRLYNGIVQIEQGERGFRMEKGGKLETAKKSPWSPEFADTVQAGKKTPLIEDTGARAREIQRKKLASQEMVDGSKVFFSKETPGRGEPIPAKPSELLEPQPTPVGPTTPPRVSNIFSRLRERPEPTSLPERITPDVNMTQDVVDTALTNQADLMKKFVESRKGETRGDLTKMGRLQTGEPRPEVKGPDLTRAEEPVLQVIDVEEQPTVRNRGIEEAYRRSRDERYKKQERVFVNAFTGEIRKVSPYDINAADLRARHGEIYAQSGIGKDPWTILDQHPSVSDSQAQAALGILPQPKPGEMALPEKGGLPEPRIPEKKPVKRTKEPSFDIEGATKGKTEGPIFSETSKLVRKNTKTINKVLREQLEEYGFEQFEDVFNDGKVYAKLFKEYKEAGLANGEAKTRATKDITRYQRLYQKIVKEEKAKIEAARGGELDFSDRSLPDLEEAFNEAIKQGKQAGDPLYDAYRNEIHKRLIERTGKEVKKEAKSVATESPQLAKAIKGINEQIQELQEAFLENRQEIEVGFLKETKRTKKLREHDFFAEMGKGQIPKMLTMVIDEMKSKELRRFLESKDKAGKFDWSQIGKDDLKAYVRGKYSTNKGKWLQVTPEEFLEVRGRDKIKYEELEREADIASTMKSDIMGTYESQLTTFDFLGLQSMYESVAKFFRNREPEKRVGKRTMNRLKRNVHNIAQDIWGDSYPTEYEKAKKVLFGKERSAKDLNHHELRVLEDYLSAIRDKHFTKEPGSKTKVARKAIGVKNYYGEGRHLYRPEVTEFEKNVVKRTNELSDRGFFRWWRQKLEGSRGRAAKGAGIFETPLRVWEELGEIKKLIYDPIKDAEKRAAQKIQKLKTEFKVRYREGLTKANEHRITSYAIQKQKGGKAVLEAMGEKIITELSEKEMKAYNFMRDKLEEAYNTINKARMKAGLKPFGKVDNYFTWWRTAEHLADEGVYFSDRRFSQRFAKAKETPFRFKKTRGTALKADIRMDGFKVFEDYMDMAFKHEEMTPEIAKGRELLMKMDDGFVLYESRPNAHSFITDWLDTASGKPKLETVTGVKKTSGWLANNLTASVLGYNIRSALIQPSAIVASYADLGFTYTRKGIQALFDQKKMDFAEKHSNIIHRQFDVSVSDLMSTAGKTKTKLAGWGMKPLQWLDKQTALATWSGAYDYAIEMRNMTNKEAIRFADDTVTRTQASARPTDLAPVQRSAIGKIATLFQTFVINHFEFLAKDVFGYMREGKVFKDSVARRVGRYIIGITLFNILYQDVLGINSPFPTPFRSFTEAIDEGDDPVLAAAKGMRELLDLVPVASSLRYGSNIGGPVAELATDIGKKVAGVPGPKKSWGSITGRILGVPGTAQIEKTKKRIEWGQNLPAALLGSGTKPEPTKGRRSRVFKPRKSGTRSR